MMKYSTKINFFAFFTFSKRSGKKSAPRSKYLTSVFFHTLKPVTFFTYWLCFLNTGEISQSSLSAFSRLNAVSSGCLFLKSATFFSERAPIFLLENKRYNTPPRKGNMIKTNIHIKRYALFSLCVMIITAITIDKPMKKR